MFGFLRAGVAAPSLAVGNCKENREEIFRLAKKANEEQVKVLCFPELCICGYSCGDLFFQNQLLESSLQGLLWLCKKTNLMDMIILVGLPLSINGKIFNCAAVLHKGKILGIVPKSHLPNKGEFFEKRWFTPADDLIAAEIVLDGQTIPIGADLLFYHKEDRNFVLGVEICEDLWSVIPPSSYHALHGVTLIANLSASNELVGKHFYRSQLIAQQSAKTFTGYLYANASIFESTTDVVFGGQCAVYENGRLMCETKRFHPESQLAYCDLDLELLINERAKANSFELEGARKQYRHVCFDMELTPCFNRYVSPAPFCPSDHEKNVRCQEIFDIQVTGLAGRVRHTKAKSCVVGISGGLDSTLALLVTVKAFDFLGLDRKNIIGITMPGFGTSGRTYQNAVQLIQQLGISFREISIKESCELHLKNIGHNLADHDVTYENAQARERMQILMDVANMESGFVVGTGDLSELALGWCTYNGDHMSMYAVNAGVPKTLIRTLTEWATEHGDYDEKANIVLKDILNTPVSPELLPPDKLGKIQQKTEDLVGSYELHDFFLYYFLKHSFSPAKILFLAEHAFQDIYDREIILKWLKVFYRRFFTQQFKRSCMPDGPKVGAVSLSPRGDWKAPSDASYAIWLDELENL